MLGATGVLQMKWKIEGFESGNPTGFLREKSGSKALIILLLERLAALHLTADEITDATLGSPGAHFSINSHKQKGRPIQLMTTGNPFYVATEVKARRT
jgi:hypothetical protein